MFSKFVNKNPRRSLTRSLVIGFTILSMITIGLTTFYSYYILVTYLEREDLDFIAQRLDDIESQLNERNTNLDELAAFWKKPLSEKSILQIYVRITDATGRQIATMPTNEAIPWPNSTSSPTSGNVEVDGWEFASRKVSLPNQTSVVLEAALDRRQELAFLSRYRKQLLLALTVATILCLLVGMAIVKRSLYPLQELSQLATSIYADQMIRRLDTKNCVTELMSVSTTFNEMLDRLRDSIDKLQRFSGDIAHELRTPLHHLQNELEITLTKDRNDLQYREVLGSCLEETVQLSRLVESLLLLARSDQPQECLNKDKLFLPTELELIRAFYEVTSEDAGIEFSVSSQDIELQANRTLFQRVIGNLVENAFTHTSRNGRVFVSTVIVEQSIQISVCDNGSGIPSSELPHVFDRLFAGRQGLDTSRGSGLGLSIVKAIVELHGGSVNIESVEGQGTTVDTFWPITSVSS